MTASRTHQQIKNAFFPTLILILGISLLQYHSIRLWQEWTGWWSGLGWSVLLELISLWLWFLAGSSEGAGIFRKVGLYVLAGVTSVILLVGPLYQVSQPIIEELRTGRAIQAEILSLKTEIRDAQDGLSVYRRNSESRLGWQRKIDETETRLVQARQRLKELERRRTRFAWLNWGPLLLQASSLVLFQLANILAISHIGKRRSIVGNKKEISKHPEHNSGLCGITGFNGSADNLVRTLQKQIKVQLEACGVSQAEFCRQHSLNPRDVSLLFHYFRNKSVGKRNVSRQVLENMREQFLAGDNSVNIVSG